MPVASIAVAAKDISMYVSIPSAYPELRADLEGIAQRQRAERLRMLAMIGLTTLLADGKRPVPEKPTDIARDSVSDRQDPQHERKSRLLARLGM